MNKTILVIDDDELVRASLVPMLKAEGFEVRAASSAEAAFQELESRRPDLILCDVSLPGINGIEFLSHIGELVRTIPVLMITAYGSVETAVEAMRQGALDYIAKPIDDFLLLERIRRALGQRRLEDENAALKQRLSGRKSNPRCIARHPSMNRVLTTLDAVSDTRATVLFQGESGTGKTLLAREIHRRSNRRDRPFVELSCGAVPDPLLESELFGHEKGAFTGAEKQKIGRFERADTGTIFLDEIANATPALQVKLLRVLQDRVYERLGDSQPREVDIRLILATNANLEDEVREGRFREDLFYRINVITIPLPSLRERSEDIPLLAQHFLEQSAVEHDRPVHRITPRAMEFFRGHDWPGNVRELQNAIEHAVLMTRDDRIDLENLPLRYQTALTFGTKAAEDMDQLSLREAIEGPEREHIMRVLSLNQGNRQKTAQMLGINRTTLFNKMRKYELFEGAQEA